MSLIWSWAWARVWGGWRRTPAQMLPSQAQMVCLIILARMTQKLKDLEVVKLVVTKKFVVAISLVL